MKKRHIAITLAALLGSAWLGGSWYSGNILAEQYPQLVERVNTEFTHLSLTSPYKIQYKTTKYDKHLFSTDIQDQLIITDTDDNKTYTIPLKAYVEHGPFPLSRLMTFRWLPVMASGSFEVLNDPSINLLFEASNKKTPLKSTFTMGYNKQVAQTLSIAAFNLRSEDGKSEFTSTPFNIESDTDLNGVGQITAKIEHIVLKNSIDEKDSDETPISLNIKDIELKSDYTPTDYQYLSEGQQQVNIGLVEIYTQDAVDSVSPAFVMKNIQTAGDVTLKQNKVNITSKMQIDQLHIEKQNLGKLAYDLALNHLDANALNQFMNVIRNVQSGDVNEEEISHALQQHLMQLMQNQPQIVLNPLSLKNSQGENKLTADIAFAQADWQKALMKGKVLSLFERLDVNAEVSKPALTETMKSLALIDDASDEQTTQAEVQAEVDDILQSAVAENILHKQNDNQYTLELKLDNGELKLNGTVIPEKDITNMLLLGILGAGFY
ncbi:YdgA family protein [Spirabiliibacterium falconis]|uniref:YdgA family protein n=1 Tax=Spirabiliibacterium falconis TaxID=572023 RepID=UPI001AAC935C|nr:YdgA family protein [Spirabiliibacterium falconis]MBE2895211.1 YdgA family protein [Spirabiliibacterium falconis]